MYVDFLEWQNLTNFVQQVDERIYIKIVDFQTIQTINLRTASETLIIANGKINCDPSPTISLSICRPVVEWTCYQVYTARHKNTFRFIASFCCSRIRIVSPQRKIGALSRL